MKRTNLYRTLTGFGLATLLASGSAVAHPGHHSDRYFDKPVRHQVSHVYHSSHYAWAPRQVFRYLQWENARERGYRRGLHDYSHQHYRKSLRKQQARIAYRQGYRDAKRESGKAARTMARNHDKRAHREYKRADRGGFDIAKGGRRDRDGHKYHRGS
jgi:hypothetical protein